MRDARYELLRFVCELANEGEEVWRGRKELELTIETREYVT
jgi:hypothetical protein